MSRKAVIIGIAAVLAAVLLISFFVVRFSDTELEKLTKDEALLRGAELLHEHFLLHDSVEFDACMDGDAWMVFTTPGSDDEGNTLDEYYTEVIVYLNPYTGELLNFATP